MKTINRTKIIIETREVLIVRGELLQGRCVQCGARVEIVRLQDTLNPDEADASIDCSNDSETERKTVMSETKLKPIRNRGFHNQPYKGETLMKLRKIFAALTLAVALVAMPITMQAQINTTPKGNLEGAWNAILIADEGGFQELEHYTFSAGRSVNEGSLIFSNEVDAVPPCGTDQGVWVRSGIRQFTLTHGAFCVDLSNGSPAFRIKFREVITINNRDDQFTGRGIFEVFDPSGGLLFSATYAVQGTRMQAEGLTFSAPASASQTDNPTGATASPWRRWMKNLLQ